MRKDIKIFLVIVLLAIIYFGSTLFKPKSAVQFISDLRKEIKPGLDSLNSNIHKQNYIYFKLDSLIVIGKYQEAATLINASNIPLYFKLDYKGQIAFKQGDTRGSIDYFTQAIDLSKDNFSKSKANRAEAYIQLKIFDSAIADYKAIGEINFDYLKPLAETYETIKLEDSALKYYQLYFKEYPDSLSIKKKIDIIKKGR